MQKRFLLALFSLLGLLAVPAQAELASGRLSLPKGPGSIEGLASSDLSPSLSNGQSSYSIPIEVPPAARSFGPTLALAYDSGAGASEMGFGWRLSGMPSIRRRTQDGLPQFDETDTFEVVGLGVPAELLQVRPGVYRPRHEDGTFLRATQDGMRWEVRTKAGPVYWFGGPGATLAEDGREAVYLLHAAHDLWGHQVVYEWNLDGNWPLLERVTWNDFGPEERNEVVFTYEDRPDASHIHSLGIRQHLRERLLAVTVTHGGSLVRRYELGYENGVHSRLTSVGLVGADGASRLPSSTFRYTEAALGDAAPVLVEMQAAPGRSPSEGDARLVDLNGDALPDLLIGRAGSYESALNADGERWDARRAWGDQGSPSFSLSSQGVELADLDGDGALDLLVSSADGAAQYLSHSGETAFSRPTVLEGGVPLATEDPNVRWADFDGDRRADLALTTSAGLMLLRNEDGIGFNREGELFSIDAEQEILFEDPGTELCDINGDRLPDVCLLRSGSLVYYLGRGRGEFEAAQRGAGVPAFDASAAFALHDLDGDGWDDLVRVGVAEVSYALAVGEGVFGPVLGLTDVPVRGEQTFCTFADMNGSGSTDIVWVDTTGSDQASWRYLELFPEGRAGLLTEIQSGLGKKQTIEYRAAASFAAQARAAGELWSTRTNVALPVVSSVTVESGLDDPPLVVDYRYTGGTFDPSERTFAGFSVAITTEYGDGATPTLVTERHFEVGLVERALRGAVRFEEKRAAMGAVFQRQSFEYVTQELEPSLDGRAVVYAYPSAILTELVEATESPVVTLIERTQDDFGNVVLEQSWGVIEGQDRLAQGDEVITTRTFANDPEAWVLGHVATETLGAANGEMVASKRFRYDGDAFEGLPLGQVARGEVSREEAWVGPDPGDYELVLATRYDEHGLAVETKDARGGGRFYGWDAGHSQVIAEAIKLHADDRAESALIVERARYDGRFGRMIEVTNHGGGVTRYDYDPFGRLTAVIQPGDSTELPTRRHRYEEGSPLSRIVTESRVRSGEAAVDLREDLFDGLGRKRASFVRDAELWLLAGVSLYDARGHARRTLLPRWVSEGARNAPPLFEDGDGQDVVRDALGREVGARSAEGSLTRTAYEPLRVLHWDGVQADDESPFEHTPTVTVQDGLGRTIAHERTQGGELVVARYGYDAAGRLVSRTDPEGHRQRFSYDGRGRRVRVDDPDQGTHTFSYDESDNLLLHRYPDGTASSFTYDLAQRPLEEDWDADGVAEIAFEYDRGPTEHLGKLVRVNEPTGFVELSYDQRGLVTETLHQIDGQTYRTLSRFDPQGRESSHVYPDGSSIEIERNARGQLAGYGKLVRFEYGASGSETLRRFSSGAEMLSTHDRDNRRTSLHFLDDRGQTVEQLSWDYDGAGNLVSVVDERTDPVGGDRSATYSYDNLQRLVGASGSWGSSAWRYSPSGNLLERQSTLDGQNSPSIAYSGAPHAPTSMGERQLVYDARGRMTADGRRTYTWDGGSHLTSVSSGSSRTESSYGRGGARRVRREVSADGRASTTHFIDAWSEVRDGELVRYVVHAGERIVRLASGTRTEAPPAAPALARVGTGRERWAALGAGGLGCLLLFLLFMGRGRRPRQLQRAGALIVGGCVAVSVLAGCSDPPGADTRRHVGELAPGDRLLLTDHLGSLLAETDERGAPLREVAFAPYGLSTFEPSQETNQYAGTPRDLAVELDHMGARYYAADLGLWTSADPVGLSDPELQVTAEFAAAHPYAYANLRPIVAVDRDGRYWQYAGPALIGAAAGAVFEGLIQYAHSGTVHDWRRVGVAAGVGGAVGLLTSLGGGGVLQTAAIAGTGKMLGGMANRYIKSEGQSVGTWQDAAADFAAGAATVLVTKGAGNALSKGRASPSGAGASPASSASPAAASSASPTPSAGASAVGSSAVGSSAVGSSAVPSSFVGSSVVTSAAAAPTTSAFTPITIDPVSLGAPAFYAPCVQAQIVLSPYMPMFLSISVR